MKTVQELVDAGVAEEVATKVAEAMALDVIADAAVLKAKDDEITALKAALKACQDGQPTGDTTAPSVPTGLVATVVSASAINLSWTASTDAVGVVGYNIFRGGVQIGTRVGTTYSDTGLTPATTYTYGVKARDAAGNLSNMSALKAAKTSAVGPPGGLITQAQVEAQAGVLPNVPRTLYAGQMITVDGTIVKDKDCPSYIEVTADNVSFINCMFPSRGSWTVNGDTAHNLNFDHCTFAGNKSAGSKAILAQGNITNCEFFGIVIAITLKDGKSTLTRNYIHDLGGAPGEHTDGVFVAGGPNGCLIEENVIKMPTDSATAAVFIKTEYSGDIVDTTCNRNWLLGRPSYAMYNEQTAKARIINTRWTNNFIERGPNGYWTWTGSVPFRSGNTDALTGAAIN